MTHAGETGHDWTEAGGTWRMFIDRVRARVKGIDLSPVPEYLWQVEATGLSKLGEALAQARRAALAAQPGAIVVPAEAVSHLRDAVERGSATELSNWAWNHVLGRRVQ